MNLIQLVERARAGDVDAFTELVAGHQRLAYGCALALLRDPETARDAVQEAFVAAWRGLDGLTDALKFPAWLRGIVRRQALHMLRVRHLVPLDEAIDVIGDMPTSEQHVEANRRRAVVLSALARLPEGLREPAVLYYLHECSQAQIAAFLSIPVTTVNNRLHAARARLRRKTLAMMNDARYESSLPTDFPARVGRIVRTVGPVVEARFAADEPPELFSVLTAADDSGRALTVQVVQRLTDGRVRAVVRDAGTVLGPGAPLVDRGVPADTREITSTGGGLDAGTLTAAVGHLARRPTGVVPDVLETGIKIIDVLAPVVRGGSVGILGGERVGTTVVAEELIRRLASEPAAVFTFVPWVAASGIRQAREEGYRLGSETVQAVFFVADGEAARDAFDTVITMSSELARAAMYPAIDPLASGSVWLDPDVIGERHATIAANVRACLAATTETEMHRARRLRRFFTQPFFIAEPYTKRPGAFVPREEALAACDAILSGAHDDVPEGAFYFAGGLDEILARARTAPREPIG